MQRFVFLDHPNDLVIKAFGKDQEELFTNAALGLMSYLYPKYIDILDHEAKTHLNLHASDEKELLIDFLTELVQLAKQREICYNQFQFEELNEHKLSVYVFGKRFRQKEIISKVKYQGLKIKKVAGGLEAEFRLDVKTAN